MRTCSADNCDKPVFGGGYCKYHQWLRKRRGGDLYQRKTTLPKESNRRKVERVRYTEQCDMLTREIREANNGKVYCFFSGEEILEKRPHFHHLKGRTGDYYTDKEWLVPAKDEYHVEGYHSKSIDWLMEQRWYTEVFLPSLRVKSQELYDKEIKKRGKSQPVRKLNPTLFDEEEL